MQIFRFVKIMKLSTASNSWQFGWVGVSCCCFRSILDNMNATKGSCILARIMNTTVSPSVGDISCNYGSWQLSSTQYEIMSQPMMMMMKVICFINYFDDVFLWNDELASHFHDRYTHTLELRMLTMNVCEGWQGKDTT